VLHAVLRQELVDRLRAFEGEVLIAGSQPQQLQLLRRDSVVAEELRVRRLGPTGNFEI